MYLVSYLSDTGVVIQRTRIPDTFHDVHSVDDLGNPQVVQVIDTVLPDPAGPWLNIEVTEAEYNATTPMKVIDGHLVPHFDAIKDAKNKDISRWTQEADDFGFLFDGKQVAGDAVSQSRAWGIGLIVQRTGMFPEGWPGARKASDNSFIILNTAARFNAFLDAMTMQGVTNFMRAQTLKVALAQATTQEEVDAITWN